MKYLQNIFLFLALITQTQAHATAAPPAPSFCGGNLPSAIAQDPNNPPLGPALPDVLDPANLNLEKLLPTPTLWLNETMCVMANYNIARHTNTLGIVLLFACFVYSLMNATYFYQTDQYFSIFGRLIIASGLIFGAPVIGKGIMNMWQGTYNTMQTRVVQSATDELEQNLAQLAPLLKNLAFTTASLNFAAAVVPEAVIDGPEELLQGFAKFTNEGVRGLFGVMVLIGSIYGIYFLAIYTSGLTAVLAGVLLSVLAPFLVLPGMTSWFTRWFSMVFLSLVTIVILPFAFSIVVRLGVTAPMVDVITTSQQIQTEFDGYIQLVELENPATLVNPYLILRTLKGVFTETLPFAFRISELFLQWMFALIVLAIAVLASIFMIQQLPRILSGFIGGTPGTSASPASGGAIGATLGAALATGSGLGGTAKGVGGGMAKAGGAALSAGGALVNRFANRSGKESGSGDAGGGNSSTSSTPKSLSSGSSNSSRGNAGALADSSAKGSSSGNNPKGNDDWGSSRRGKDEW